MAAAEAPSSDVGQAVSLDQTFLQNLPANGRNAESLILMSPGITTAAGGRSDGGFNANGLRSNTNYFTLDGVSLNQPTSTDTGFGGFRGGGGGGPGGMPPGPPREWWRRGESNPRPEDLGRRCLRAQPTV